MPTMAPAKVPFGLSDLPPEARIWVNRAQAAAREAPRLAFWAPPAAIAAAWLVYPTLTGESSSRGVRCRGTATR